MTLHSDAAKTGTAARHQWLDDAADDELVTPSTPRRISIFGLGYVGAVSLACLARDGHEMTGVDIDPAKLEMLRRGQAPIALEQLVRAADVLVVATRTLEVLAALQSHTRPEQLLLDVVLLPDREAQQARYRGVCW